MSELLEVAGISKSFGGLAALTEVSFSVRQGQIKALIGPNGAGKTTMFNVITGTHRPTSGTICMAGQRITGLKPHAIAQLGIGRTFQNINLFATLSVYDNVLIGRHARTPTSFWQAAMQLPSCRRAERESRAVATDLLHSLGLAPHADDLAHNLPFGKQRLLETARALATGPKLLLLDEPAAGLSSEEIGELKSVLQRIRARGVTILLVEHNMNLVMDISDEVVVLNFGRVIADGEPAAVQANQAVGEAYLGTGVRRC